MRFFKPLIAIVAVLTLFSACEKETETFDTTPRFYFINAATAGFDNNLILFPASDTITFNVIISSTYLLPKDVTITFAVGDTARQSYNAANAANYEAMPSAAYSFPTTITATTGSLYDTVPVKINKQFLVGKNYMLPIVITSISDYKLDTARRFILLHTAGTEYAGIYSTIGLKTLFIGDSSDNKVSGKDSFAFAKNLVPVSDTVSAVDYADLGANGWQYLLIDSSDVFVVKANDILEKSIQQGSFKVSSHTFNSLTGDIYIKSSYKNLSGDERIIEESFTLQQ